MNIVIMIGILITLVTGVPVLLQVLRAHPRGLLVLFFAEMWERFSYYGMRALLIYYLTQHLLFDDDFAASQFGSYTSLVYLLPLFGGMLADRLMGTRKAVAFGALLLVAGHLGMAYEGRPAGQDLIYGGQHYAMQVEGRGETRQVRVMVDGQPHAFGPAAGGGLEIKDLTPSSALPTVLPKGAYELKSTRDPMGVTVFYLALSLIIMGVGFLKPNISTLVGQLYPQGDPRRDSGFTLYYYGINLGSFWAAVLCGYLGQEVGWWAGFGLAGVGMAAGWLVFVLGKPLLQGKGEPPDPAYLAKPVAGPINREWLIYILGVLGVGGVFFLVQRNSWVGAGLSAATVAALVFIAWFVIFKCDKVQRERMMLALVLVFGAVVFWTLFEQAGSSLSLFADRNVDLALTGPPQVYSVLGHDVVLATRQQMMAAGAPRGLWIDTTFTSSQTQSFNAAFILIFAPVFAAMWAYLARRRVYVNPVLKFGLGLVQVGLGFLVVVWSAGLADAEYRVPLMILGLLYLLHTTGELFLSPVGLSEITKLAAPQVAAFMMAVWFLATSIAQFVGGKIAALAGTETIGGQVLDPKAAFDTSLHMFQVIGLWGIGFGLAFIALSPILKRWSHGADEAANHPAA